MNITVLDEPELEFAAGGRHLDPKFGIRDYGPADATSTTARTIRVGIVGDAASISGIRTWLDRCREPIAAKDSRLVRLFPPFPGFQPDTAFHSTLEFDSRLERTIPTRLLRALTTRSPDAATRDAVELYMAELEALDEEVGCNVIICTRPDLPTDTPPDDDAEGQDEEPEPVWANFHDLLKAQAMRYQRPLQIIRRCTWDPSYKPPTGTDQDRQLQDEATRAWNLHTALYYKAGGVPWRLPRHPTDLTTCYVGVSFYRIPDHETLRTSVAQVFNERGDGVIVRGASVRLSKHDRQPHLTQDDAAELLRSALRRYRTEHRTIPARVAVHKTSSYTQAELDGLRQAADDADLDCLELLWLPSDDMLRLFRQGEHPPLRGTLLSLDDARHILYTRGSVPFYGTYPGMYIPRPLPFRLVEVEHGPFQHATELLGLTKMNWNQTQLDGRQPITLRTSDRVGEILRHVEPDERVAARYAYYM